MATSTFNPTFGSQTTNTTQHSSGLFSNIAKRFVEQRVAKARHHTAEYVARMSDEQLASFGWSRQEIQRLRNG